VTSSAPTALVADAGLLIVLERLLACAAPDEGCALLLGDRRPDAWCLRLLWPCCNVWPVPGQRDRRFAIDPREQLVAQRWGRARQLQVLGAAHSHPCSAAVPSPTDCRLCLAPALMVIRGASGDLQSWWLAASDSQPMPLPWRMED
jgi:[CysO sulfur-carrier protein]-S-L-cysteine hydrolase